MEALYNRLLFVTLLVMFLLLLLPLRRVGTPLLETVRKHFIVVMLECSIYTAPLGPSSRCASNHDQAAVAYGQVWEEVEQGKKKVCDTPRALYFTYMLCLRATLGI